MSDFKPCIVIPCYNHEAVLGDTLSRLQPFNLPIFVIDDGSKPEAAAIIAETVKKFSLCSLHIRTQNGGKGAAIKDSFRIVQEKGFTHLLQIDADGQHQVSDIPKFLNLAKEFPYSFILGQAVYDESVPKSRLYGRYITHFWVMVETLSTTVVDTMCGFRVYPLSEIAKVNLEKIGNRMDFDVEIVVKSIWQGVNFQKIPTQVIYPENGFSNFHYLKSNLRITWMHTKLFFGMLIRLPLLIFQKRKK